MRPSDAQADNYKIGSHSDITIAVTVWLKTMFTASGQAGHHQQQQAGQSQGSALIFWCEHSKTAEVNRLSWVNIG